MIGHTARAYRGVCGACDECGRRVRGDRVRRMGLCADCTADVDRFLRMAAYAHRAIHTFEGATNDR